MAMSDDLVQYAQVSPGVGEPTGADLVELAQVAPVGPPKKERHRPNNGRKKRTNRNPLDEPPWDMLRALEYPVPPGLYCLPYTPLNWRRGPRYVAWRKGVHERYGYICHLCKHDNAHTADHLIPLSLWSNQPYNPQLARPAHGVEGCPTCGIKCNSSRGNRQLAIAIGNYQPPVSL